MYALKTGEIIPGVGIGPFKLGADEDSILQISSNFSIEQLSGDCKIYVGKDVMIWVNSNRKISQVLVEGSFQGKLLGKFGIGTFFQEMEDYLGEKVHMEYVITCVYEFSSLPGVCFELEDIDVPDDDLLKYPYEKFAPIQCISVFLPEQEETEKQKDASSL